MRSLPGTPGTNRVSWPPCRCRLMIRYESSRTSISAASRETRSSGISTCRATPRRAGGRAPRPRVTRSPHGTDWARSVRTSRTVRPPRAMRGVPGAGACGARATGRVTTPPVHRGREGRAAPAAPVAAGFRRPTPGYAGTGPGLLVAGTADGGRGTAARGVTAGHGRRPAARGSRRAGGPAVGVTTVVRVSGSVCFSVCGERAPPAPRDPPTVSRGAPAGPRA